MALYASGLSLALRSASISALSLLTTSRMVFFNLSANPFWKASMSFGFIQLGALLVGHVTALSWFTNVPRYERKIFKYGLTWSSTSCLSVTRYGQEPTA